MKRVLVLLSIAFLPLAAMAAAPEPEVEREIAHLLDHLGKSGCQFYRNGSWHSSGAARRHLEKKYHYLLTKGLVESTGDFILRAGSRSSMSSKPYLVRCAGDKPIESKQWLFQELTRYRDSTKTKTQ
jgi:hypothetical protein